MKKILLLSVCAVFLIGSAAFAQSQDTEKSKSEAFPSGTFYMEFVKRMASNPFYVWQGLVGGKFTGYRKGKSSVTGEVDFQAVGAKPYQNQISVAGTGYLLKGCFEYAARKDTSISACDNHFSSHVADLPKLIKAEGPKGTLVPAVRERDMNVISFGIEHEMSRAPLRPTFTFRFQPMSFHYRGGAEFYDEPVFLSGNFLLLRTRRAKIFFTSKHEIGKSSFSDERLSLDLFPHGQKEGRARIFVGFSPNRQIQASVDEGWRGGGWILGVRLMWDVH